MRIPLYIGKSQMFAGFLLLTFLSQSLWLISHRPIDRAQAATGAVGRILYDRDLAPDYFPLVRDGVTAYRLAGMALLAGEVVLPSSVIAARSGETRKDPHSYGVDAVFGNRVKPFNSMLMRLPFAVCGVWLGGAIWWVTRRLYGDAGGFVALALFTFSPSLVAASAIAGPEIIGSWAVFGLVFTAIGVGHTLYAPPRKWIPRIIILGVAIGVALGSALVFWIMVPLALGMMLYLAPGRRLAAMSAWVLSAMLGIFILWAAYGFHGALPAYLIARSIEPRTFLLANYFHPALYLPYLWSRIIPAVLFGIAISTYLAWPRTRYFGTSSPLLAAAVLWLSGAAAADRAQDLTTAIAPLIFVFIGGIVADLLETRYRKQVRIALFSLLTANAVLCLLTVPS